MSATEPSRITPAEFDDLCHSGVPLAGMMGIRAEHISYGHARLRLPWNEQYSRPGGVVAGPALVTLADTTMWALVMSAVGPMEMAVTSDLTIHFLRKAPADTVIAEGELLRIGRRQAVSTVRIYGAGGGGPVAHASGTYVLP